MRMPLSSLQTDHRPRDRLPSITALLTRLIMCIGVGFVAGVLFHYFWRSAGMVADYTRTNSHPTTPPSMAVGSKWLKSNSVSCIDSA